LADVYGYFRDQEIYELGVVMANAFNAPAEIKKLDPARNTVERVFEQLESGDLPAMLRAPKKKSKVEGVEGNGAGQ
jgi:hypothetical protein